MWTVSSDPPPSHHGRPHNNPAINLTARITTPLPNSKAARSRVRRPTSFCWLKRRFFGTHTGLFSQEGSNKFLLSHPPRVPANMCFRFLAARTIRARAGFTRAGFRVSTFVLDHSRRGSSTTGSARAYGLNLLICNDLQCS